MQYAVTKRICVISIVCMFVSGCGMTNMMFMPPLPRDAEQAYEKSKYKNYYYSIRNKIYKRAYLNRNKPIKGEVAVEMLIERNGELSDVKILEDKSTSDEYLREITLKSVRESSPFPPFPDSFNYQACKFKIILDFQAITDEQIEELKTKLRLR